MNKEQIIDEVYKNYKRFTHNKNEKNGNYGDYSKWGDNPLIAGVQHLTKDSFIQMIKIDSEFSQTWGLKIEERELSLEERTKYKMKRDNIARTIAPYTHQILNNSNIPTRLITITYNNETIESYE
jgi:hypothetical protein